MPPLFASLFRKKTAPDRKKSEKTLFSACILLNLWHIVMYDITKDLKTPMNTEKKTHTISVLVENKFGALARIAGLFSGRGYNIESLSVNHTHDPNRSRMTIVTAGTDEILEQIEKQLNKLVDVISVEDVTLLSHIERGLALLKVKCTRKNRAEIVQLTETFHGKVLAVKANEIYIEISGAPDHINDFIILMEEFGILEVCRAGRTAIRKD